MWNKYLTLQNPMDRDQLQCHANVFGQDKKCIKSHVCFCYCFKLITSRNRILHSGQLTI